MKTLVVGNDMEVARLTHGLERNGHNVVAVTTGAAALEGYEAVDFVLLDLDLTDIDGLEVCRQVRVGSRTPIIAFTAGGGGLDRVLGLQAGADDCLEKPYEFRELLARIDAVMRRLGPEQTHACHSWANSVSVRGLCMNVAARVVKVHGKFVELTRKEFDLLLYLACHPETVLTRERIMAEVWGDETTHALSTRASRTIDTHVSSLRGKLGDAGWIMTSRGIGFRLGSGRPPATG
jgi:DNA-binding response OmpR family regulator